MELVRTKTGKKTLTNADIEHEQDAKQQSQIEEKHERGMYEGWMESKWN